MCSSRSRVMAASSSGAMRSCERRCSALRMYAVKAARSRQRLTIRSSPGSRSERHTWRSTKPAKPSTRRSRRRKAATSSSERSASTRRRDIETYIGVRLGNSAQVSAFGRVGEPEGRLAPAPDARAGKEPEHVNGATTLIVDDNEGMRLLARMRVDEAGGTVIAEAADGNAAVERALEHQPQIVLMDHRMPGADGVEATRRIKAAQPGAMVVAWTTVDDPAAARRFFDAGAAEFVLKHDVATLERVLRRFCA